MNAQAVRLSNIDIDNALKNKDFEVLFQPLFDLTSGVFSRVESFVRWRHRQLGVLPPGAFISYFEQQGRMSELTRYVLDRALSDYLAWRGPQGPGFSINLALSDLSDGAFAGHLGVALRDRGIQPSLITLECPMPPVTMAVDEAAAHFTRLSETGVRLAIEVRGRANEFLKTVSPFPFDEIKTGGAAILRFARTVRGPGLSAISELLEIAKAARASIVAVGVEDQASLSALRSLGFSAAQGNHLAQVGRLSELPVEKINDVRQLLGLPPLSSAEIAAIATPVASAPAARAPASARVEQTVDQTVERLSQRIARLAEEQGSTVPRDKIKAALQAGDRTALTKAAAIAKAKRKGGAAADLGDLHSPEREEDHGASAGPDIAPARKLLDRLSDAFDQPRAQDQTRTHRSSDEGVAQPGVPRMTSDDTPQTPPPRAGRSGALSLPVGGARAYFRQAMHVAAIWPRSDAAESARDVRGDLFEFEVDDLPNQGSATASPVVATAAARQTSSTTPPALRDDVVKRVASPDIASRPSPTVDESVVTPTATEAPAADEPTSALFEPPSDDVAQSDAAAIVAAFRERRRPARARYYFALPFDKRLYLPPRHFWPRSWRRWWRDTFARPAA